MKPQHDFIAERPVARHAGLVAKSGAQAFDPSAAMARLSERLVTALPEVLGALGGERLPEIKALEPREGIMRELLSRGPNPCSHGLVAAQSGPQLLVSLDFAGALQLVDMAFGGEGKVPDPVPEKLPLSVQLVVARIEARVAELVATIAGMGASEDGPAFAPLRRQADIAALRPFAADRALWQASFEICFAGAEPWTVRLTVAADQAASICGSDDGAQPSSAAPPGRREARPGDQSFGNIPLTLRATLVDMRIPLARLASLRPGDVLPVSVARQVPLSTGDAVIALGTVGEVDDRVALQITTAFPSQENLS